MNVFKILENPKYMEQMNVAIAEYTAAAFVRFSKMDKNKQKLALKYSAIIREPLTSQEEKSVANKAINEMMKEPLP